VTKAQIAVSLAGRSILKLLPDYGRPKVYGLNGGSSAVSGTLLAFDSSNGSILDEIPVGLNPTDMAITPAGEALYVVNTGDRTVMKVDLESFAMAATRSITTPNAYDPNNPLHIAAGTSNLVYFTDGAWAPAVWTFDFLNGTNVSLWNDNNGVGGLTATRDGSVLYTWRQYGWSAGNANSWVTRLTIDAGVLTPRETSPGSSRDPLDVPLLLNDAQTMIFNKRQVLLATNVSVRIGQFSDNIYSISRRGDLAFGELTVFSSATGAAITNLPFSSRIQAVSMDDRNLFLYRSSSNALVLEPISLLVGAGWETNQPPIASFTRTPTNATTLRAIVFDASTSTDDQGRVGLQYAWDWENDGLVDTQFTTNAMAIHRYSIAGTKTAALHVKDRYGATSSRTQTFNVVQEDDPGLPGGGNPIFEVPFAAADIAFDPVRPYAYASSYTNKALAVLNLTNGLIEKEFDFDWAAERIAISPNGEKMYVTLLRRPHSSYWFGGHTNYIAEFDLTSQTKTKEFRIEADPYDMVVTDGGILIMTGGSDQWTEIRSYHTLDGQLLDTVGSVYEGSPISLHPSQTAVYRSDNPGLSPADIYRYDFDPVTGVFLSWWDSPYFSEYPMRGDVWCFPGGSNVLVRGAHVFTSSPIRAEDMRFVRTLSGGIIGNAEFDSANDTLFALGSQLRRYKLSTGEFVSSQPVTNGTAYLHVAGRFLYLAWREGNRTRFQRLLNPALPALRFASFGDGVVLSWTGAYILQQSSTVTGLFEDITSISPFTNLWSQSTPARFFRLRAPP